MSDLREKIQQDAHLAWLNHNKHGTVEITTGLGKTFVALHALHSMKKDHRIHLHLAETNLRKKAFLKSVKIYDEIYSCDTMMEYNIKFACYQGAAKWMYKDFGLVIADEIHDSLTPSYSKFYENNNYDALIGLSAKIDLDTEYISKSGGILLPTTKEFFLQKYCPIVYKYDMLSARQDDLNRELKIHVIRHKLDNIIPCIKSGNVKKTFYVTEKQHYDFWHKKSKALNGQFSESKRRLYKKIATVKKNNVLYGAPSKIRAIKKLIKHVDRALIFGNDIDALLNITPYTVSSRNKDKHKGKNEYFIRKFNEGQIDCLASFKMLKQGETLEDLKNLIIMSYYSSNKDAIQRFGRIRNGEEEGQVFIFVTEGTQEETWFQAMTLGMSKVYNFINHKSVDECINYLKYKNNEKEV